MNKYYKRLDIIRIFSCIAILFYHLNILKGGYLAVCTFFVLSGYLSVISSFKKDKFSLKDYYLNKLKRLYLPLLIVVFISVGIISILPIDYINLKPETTSILFGYNNYWQLNANLDYFIRNVSSPFMHLWYISILIQFELVFPLIFIIFKKLGEKISKKLPCILLGTVGIISYIFFIKTVNDGNIMNAYYGTFTRLFSILFGLCLGFIHYYYGTFIFKDNKSKIIYGVYLLLLALMFIFIDAGSNFFTIGMILTTLVSIRLIDYSIVDSEKNKIISVLSNISYEVYLIQYPIIFILESFNVSTYLIVLITIILTLILSYIINYSYTKQNNKLIQRIILVIVILLSLFGLYKYVVAKDYTKEMKKLSNDLETNRKLIEEKQKQYKESLNENKSDWESLINNPNSTTEDLKEYVTNLKITGVGDSIMELCVAELYEVFPNGYFDAAENRTEYYSIDIIKELDKKGLLGDIVVLSLGTNGKCLGVCKDMVMESLGNREIYWLNATRPDFNTFNPSLIETAEKYDNLHIIDWINIIKDHKDLLIRDGIHPNVKGRMFYAKSIYDWIYNDYLEKFNKEKEEKIQSKKTYIGNDLLIGLYDYLDISDDYIIDTDFNYDSLKEKLDTVKEDKTLSKNIILVLDKSSKLSESEYKDITTTYKDLNITIVDLYNELNIDNKIDFYSEIKNNKDYLKIDNLHLTDKGNKELSKKIKEITD